MDLKSDPDDRAGLKSWRQYLPNVSSKADAGCANVGKMQPFQLVNA
jgi:hypothetical protein